MNTPRADERRQVTRFIIALPVEFENGTGITRDVSASGVFFETERPFALGERVCLTLVLGGTPPNVKVRLQCQGEVVRVEQLGGKVGVAVAFTVFGFDIQR